MFINAIVFLMALSIGSFLNTVIYRTPRKEPILWARSQCSLCKHRLRIVELIPVFSYIWLGGRCGYCRGRINHQYLLVEIITSITLGLIFLKWHFSEETLVGWIFTGILTIAAFTDFNDGVIPNSITYPGIIIGLLLSPYMAGIQSSARGAVFLAGIFLVIALLSQGGIGGGDIKLAAVIGIFLGFSGSVMTLIIASWAGGAWASVLLIQGKAERKTPVKFGPFLSAAAWLVWMYEFEILNLYWRVFG